MTRVTTSVAANPVPAAPVDSPRTAPGEIIIGAEPQARSQSLRSGGQRRRAHTARAAHRPRAPAVLAVVRRQLVGAQPRLRRHAAVARNEPAAGDRGRPRRASRCRSCRSASARWPASGAGSRRWWSPAPRFGLTGNVVPAVLAAAHQARLGRRAAVAARHRDRQLLVGTGAGGTLSEMQLTIVAAGGGFLHRPGRSPSSATGCSPGCSWCSASLSGALIIVLIAISWPLVDVAAALTIGDGPWILVLTGAILVFSFVGLVWSTGSRRPGPVPAARRASGAASMLTASLRQRLPPFVLIVYGSLLAASDPIWLVAFVDDPSPTLTTVVPAVVPGAARRRGRVRPAVRRDPLDLLRRLRRCRRSGSRCGGKPPCSWWERCSARSPGLAPCWPIDLDGDLPRRRDHARGSHRRVGGNLRRRDDDPQPAVRQPIAPAAAAASTRRPLGEPRRCWSWPRRSATASPRASAGWLAWQGYLFGLVGLPTGSELARADAGRPRRARARPATPLVAGVPSIRRQETAAKGLSVRSTVGPLARLSGCQQPSPK